MANGYAEYAALARKLEVGALALVPGPNFARLTGASFHGHERPMAIFIPPEGPPAAIVPDLERSSFARLGFPGNVHGWRDQDGYAGAFARLAAEMPLARVAVEGQVMRVFVHHAIATAWPGIEVIDAETAISGLRVHKTDDEVAALEAAIHISETALGEVLDRVRVGQSETELRDLLTAALFAHGSEAHAFDPIVAGGRNSALPHATPGDYRLQPGDALLLDFGARKDGFAADITRTVFVGHVPDAARDVYETVLAANLKGHAIARPGATAHDVDDAVTGLMEASPYADRIRTRTGHGLGRDVHEAPYIIRGNQTELEPGMVFTIEPGLYKIGELGIRIEDDVLVTADGIRSLTTFPKELRVVG